MQYISDTMELQRRFYLFAASPHCPAELQAKLLAIPGTQADLISQGAQILYAHFDLLDAQGKELMGLLYTYGLPGNQNWTQWSEDNHSAEIVALVEGTLDVADAPQPLLHFRDGTDWRNPTPTEDAPEVPAPQGRKPGTKD